MISSGEQPSLSFTLIEKKKEILKKLENLEKLAIEKLLTKEKNKNTIGDLADLAKLSKNEIDDIIEKFPTCFVAKCSETLDLYYSTFINNFERLITYYKKWHKKEE